MMTAATATVDGRPAPAGIAVAAQTTRRGWRTLGAVLLVVNALDLSTSLLHGRIDRIQPAPRTPAELALQIVLLVPTLWWVLRRAPWALRALAGLPVPPVARGVVLAMFGIQLAHVALRQETYPFSYVGMFSSIVPAQAPRTWTTPMYIIRGPGGQPVELDFFREGHSVFSRYLDIDYKTAWVLRLYAATSPEAYTYVAHELSARGLPPPVAGFVTYDSRTGRVLGFRPTRRPEPYLAMHP